MDTTSSTCTACKTAPATAPDGLCDACRARLCRSCAAYDATEANGLCLRCRHAIHAHGSLGPGFKCDGSCGIVFPVVELDAPGGPRILYGEFFGQSRVRAAVPPGWAADIDRWKTTGLTRKGEAIHAVPLRRLP